MPTMRRLRRISWTFVVLTTAASTLLANAPLTVCACPNVPVRRPNNASEPKTSSCCCGNNCCPASSDEGSCCNKKPASKKEPQRSQPSDQKHENRRSGSSPSEATIGPSECQKSTVQPETSTLTNSEVKASDDLISVGLSANLITPEVAYSADSSPTSMLYWRDFRMPPPTDLVISLLHFLI